MTQPKAIVSPVVSGLLAVSVVYGWWSPNPIETAWTGLVLWLTIRLFWWQEAPGVLLFALITPFIESHGVILEANNYGLTLNETYENTGRATFWASSIGYVSVMLGFLVGGRNLFHKLPRGEDLITAAKKLDFNRIFIAIFISQAVVQFTRQAIPYTSNFRQIEFYIGGVATAITIVFTLHHFLQKQNRWLFIGFFTYLIASSFYSYFSSWRFPITLLIIASLSTIRSFRTPQIVRLSPLLIGGFVLVFVWQTVKGEYREFLSQGERSQAIRISKTEALNKFSDLTLEALQKDTLLNDKVVSRTYQRVGYVEYFSAAMSKVPQEIPHQNGSLLSESLNFALIPRFINPNKGVKNDRIKVERFTGYYFGAASFASFSLGHYCEAYIDWGPFWMHLHLFIYGLFGALLLKVTLIKTKDLNGLLIWGILFVIMNSWGTYQQDMVTVLGKTVWGTFCQLFLFLPVYKALNRYYSK